MLGDNWLLDLADGEVVAIFVSVEILSELVDAGDLIVSAERADAASWVDFVTSQVVVTDEVLTGLVNVKTVRQLLSSQEKREGVATVIRAVRLSDFDCVIGQVVVNDVRELLAVGEETQHLAVMVEELLLRGNLATTEALFEVLNQLLVSLWWDRDARLGERIGRCLLGVWLGSSGQLSES